MPPADKQLQGPILPLPMVGLLVAVCLGGSWLMVPKQGELVERLFKDKQYTRIVSILQDDAHGMRSSDISGLSTLDAAQMTALSRLLSLTPREQIRSVFAPRSTLKYDLYVHNVVLAAVRYVDVLSPEEAHDIILPAVERVPEASRLELLGLLAQNALAVARPDLAAEALRLASQCASSDWKVIRQMVECHRWNSDPKRARSELARWLEAHRSALDGTQLSEAEELAFQLAMECGAPGDAFSVCMAQIQRLDPSAPIPAQLVENAHLAALQSGRSGDLLPTLRRFVQEMPASRMKLQELRAAAQANATNLQPYLKWAKILAQWSDWNQDFTTAYDHHLRLAVLGDAASRDRCIALTDYLGRTEECCDLLSILGDVPDHPEYAILHARQLAELGHDDEAKVRFESWLALYPRDREAHFDYACLLEDMGDEPASRKALASMLEVFPQDVPAMRKLATACVRDGDLSGALGLYKRIPAAGHTLDSLENFALVAESLDDPLARFEALLFTKARTEKPGVQLLLNLADAARQASRLEDALQILEEGLLQQPQSALLRLALADALAQAERSDEAAITLQHERLKDNYDAAARLLELAPTLTDAGRALNFLGQDIEHKYKLSARQRLHLAVLHARINDSNAAARLFASVKESPSSIRMIAEARSWAGQSDEAARLMTSHVQTNPNCTAQDWIFLGELWEQLGRLEDAQNAYDHSLVLLTSDLPDTAAN
jgi:tetratricopeptide (TPR) repeat protein